MKTKLLIFIAIFIGSVCQAQYPDPVEIHSSNDIHQTREQKKALNHQQLNHFFDDYLKHYNDYLNNSNNKETILQAAESYHLPALQIIPNIPLRVINSHLKLAIGTQNFLNKLRTSGVDHMRWEKVDIHQLSEKSAIASNVGIRYKKNGDIFNKAAATFMMYKSEDGWKIAALTLHDVENTIVFE